MRIVAISDQHGHLPEIPECDLLLVAGDNCPDYPTGAHDRLGSGPQVAAQAKWFRHTWVPWRMRQPAKHCFLTWGNHDYCGEVLGMPHHLFVDDRTIAVVDSVVAYAGLKLWLTPWSSQFKDWAFMAEDSMLLERYRQIPGDVDVIVSHQPPAGYGDLMVYDVAKGWERLGSAALLESVTRVQPRLLICGHIHSGFGRSLLPLGDANVTEVYNVAIMDEQYNPVHPVTVIDL